MPGGRRAWTLAALAVALPSLALVANFPSRPLILGVLNNAAHAPVFGALAITLLALLRLRDGASRRSAFAWAWLIAVAAGGAIELIQPSIGRGAEWGDFWNDALGAAGGLAVAALWQSRGRNAGLRGRWLPLAVLVSTATVALWPLGTAVAAYALRAERFPTLFVNASALDGYFLRSRGVELSRVGDSALAVRIVGGRFPGVTLAEPAPDWSGYRRLVLELANPGDRPLALTLRVHDRAHDNRARDRFNRDIGLAPHTRLVVAIPLVEIAAGPTSRVLDLSRVAGIILFSAGDAAERGATYRLMRIWLE